MTPDGHVGERARHFVVDAWQAPPSSARQGCQPSRFVPVLAPLAIGNEPTYDLTKWLNHTVNISMSPPQETDTREKILAAAHTVFVRNGVAAARTQEIADEAGVNKALIHYYFRTKEELARAVIAQVHMQILPQAFRILVDPARTVERKVRDVVDFELDTFSKHPYLPGFVASEMFTNPQMIAGLMERAGPPPFDVLQAQLDAAADEGRIRPVRAKQFVLSLLGAMVFPFVLKPMFDRQILPHPGGFASFIEERKRTLADFFLAALRP